jgi:hypothetical protein
VRLLAINQPSPLGIVALMSFSVITPTLRLALNLGAAVLLVDLLARRVVAAMSGSEWLVAGRRG